MEQQGTPLIDDIAVLDSLRYLGVTTTDAVNELIDNSLDADASKVYVYVLKEKDGGISIIIEDDGCGIAPENIDRVLAFGGRLERAGRVRTGRFGWGLSSSAVCQTTHCELYSNSGKGWFFSYIDLDELRDNEPHTIPEAVPLDPPGYIPLRLKGSETGTVVYLRNCDRLEWAREDTIATNLASTIGRTQRYYLNGGKEISIFSIGKGGKEGKVNELIPEDPLMIMEGCRYHDQIGMGQLWHNAPYIITIDDVIDPETGSPAIIGIKLSVLDVATARKNLSYKALSKIGINRDNQGFYLIRNQREIGKAQTLGLFTRHNSLNYFRADIIFPPCLDADFGIQTNKSRFSLSQRIGDKIREAIEDEINHIKNYIERESQKIKAGKTGSRRAGEAAMKGEKVLKPSRIHFSEEAKEADLRKREAEFERKLGEIDEDPDLTDREKARERERARIEISRPPLFDIEIGRTDDGGFYQVFPTPSTNIVMINQHHPFFRIIYERAVATGQNDVIDLLLFTLAKAELAVGDDREKKQFYDVQRKEWSTILKVYCENFEETSSVGSDNDEI